MHKIAVIFESSPFDRKGLFNAVHNRIKHLLATGECQIDAYCIHSWDTDFSRRVRHTPLVENRMETVDVEGIVYRMLWYDFSLVDHVFVEKCRIKPFFFGREVKKWISSLREYDCISAHSFTGALVAGAASAEYGMPFYVTWHGSDVHTHPMKNALKFRETASVMEKASCNFFVSEALKSASDKITLAAVKEVMYNGVSEQFFRFPDHCRSELRSNNGIGADDKVVAFVGSIAAVKNVSVLQPLFHEIRAGYSGALKFWVVGDGKLRGRIEPQLREDTTLDVSFWGNVPSEYMSSVMNCIDVLVLPSLNEGLPLVCAEAINSGASVVGSDVGGISEVIGRENVVPLGPDFVTVMASKVIECLKVPAAQSVPPSMDWGMVAQKELSYIKSLSL